MGSPFAMKHRRNPMSMALHSSLAPCEIPPVASLRDKASKVGHLKKLSGKGILTSGTWRERFCLLVKNKLYYFESEDSTGGEKSCGFVNLEYFDTCSEASTRMARKATNVLVIGASDKGFFESHSGRHYFAAETLPEMKEWVNAISSAMNTLAPKEKRAARDGSLTPGQTKRDSKSKQKEDDSPTGTFPRSSMRLDHVTKGRVRGPQGRRLPRKSLKPGVLDQKSEGADSIGDSEEDSSTIRDSRGRATSLSALEASSETHQKISSLDTDEARTRGQGRSEIEKKDLWAVGKIFDQDGGTETPEIDLIYTYSSSETSDEENEAGNANPDNNNYRKSAVCDQTMGSPGNFIPRRPRSRAGNLRGTVSRNASMTPPPCVLRKYRRDQSSGSANGRNSGESKLLLKDKGREESPSPLLPEFDSRLQRTSSGSSLSTLTADTYTNIGNSMSGGHFPSLQRKAGRLTNGLHPQINVNFANPRHSVSANASPLMNGFHNNGGHAHFHRNGYSSHNSSPNSTFDRNGSYGGNRGLTLERNVYAVTKDLESVAHDLKQVDIDVTELKQDVGTVQENIVTVKGAVDATRDRVNKLQNQVHNVERQVASIIKEASVMKEEAKELLESANISKQTHEHLLEEARTLIGYFQQSGPFLSNGTCHRQLSHSLTHFQPNCCSPSPCGTPVPTYYGHGQQHNANQVTMRNQTKNPEKTFDANNDDMETLDESSITQNGNSPSGFYDTLGFKGRKSKSSNSNVSSGINGTTSNRNSVVEPLERKPGSRSPNNNEKNGEQGVKISQL